MAMKIMLCLSALLMAGCCGSPQVSGLRYGDNAACANLVRDKPYLVIVTDAQMGSHGVFAGLFMQPRFFGTIESQTACLRYFAKGRRLRIGQDKYDLAEGCLFAVSFAGETPVVRQIDMPVRDMVEAFLEGNTELKDFFRDGGSTRPHAGAGQ